MEFKWGIIGCGGIADRRTLPGMMLTKTSRPYAVMDSNPDAARAVAEKYGAKYAFTDYRDVLALEEIDAVYIASPVFCHKEQVLAAAKAGKHILLEKPLGLNTEESLEIIEACQRAGVKLAAGFMMRYHAYHQAIKKAIADGLIGEVVSMRAQFSCWYPEIEGAWRQKKALSGGGALVDLGVHCIDLVMYLSGLKCTECIGYVGNNTFNYEVDDSASLIMKMSNGANAYVDVNFNIPDNAARCPIEFYGTKGSIMAVGTLSQVEGGTVDVLVCEEKGYDASQNRTELVPLKLEVELGNMYTKEIDAFVDAVLSNREPEASGRATLDVQRIVDLVYAGGGKLRASEV